MDLVQKTLAAVALASLGGTACAGAVTFEEIERADTVSGRYISHLSATEMESVEGSVAPVVIAGVAAAAGAVANGGHYWVNTPNPTAAGLAWSAGTGFTSGVVGGIATTLPKIGAVLAIGAAPFISTIPQPPLQKCGAAGLAC
ncbi:hypothetical protein [Cupriavidus nantongensis]|uniref:Uncharacterized protein n=1 Tax=Cupriavidus nantongensis TaxID=1796606 RepID=A0A142JS81_9BURK|nr:hypothetical protein [Cupriavidus nantongensis]AMR80943.1 hypothetical protein A2G96_24305 [Cupriavidus nantongensis]